MADDAAQALKARAVSLGAPPALPSYCSTDWVLFQEAKAPVFIIDGGVHIPKLESAKITYAGYFAPVADTSSPLIKMRLRCKCCTTAPGINFHNVTARGDASSFSNAAEHLLTCPSNPPLTVEDSLKRADKKKQPMVLAATQEGARLIMDGEDHLKQLGMSKEMLWEGIVEMLVADAEPLGAVGRFGMRRLFTQLKLPLMGVTTSHRIFEKMTKELIKVPIEEQLRVWSLTPMGYNAGARPCFQPSYRCSLPGGSVRLPDGKNLDVPPGIFEVGPLQLTQGNDGWTSGSGGLLLRQDHRPHRPARGRRQGAKGAPDERAQCVQR